MCLLVDERSHQTVQRVSEFGESDSDSKGHREFLPFEPKRDEARKSRNGALSHNTEEHPANQNRGIAIGISSNCDDSLKHHHSDGEADQSDPGADIVDQEANEEGSEDIGEGEDGIEELKLRLTNAQVLLHVDLEGLRVVEGEFVAKDHHGDEEEHGEADLASPVRLKFRIFLFNLLHVILKSSVKFYYLC